MRAVRHSDARQFLARTRDLLESAPAENNLILGILDGIVADEPAEPPLLVAFENEGVTQAVAIHAPPHPLVLSRASEVAAHTFVHLIAAERPALKKLLGPRATVEHFAAAWASKMQARSSLRLVEQIHELVRVVTPQKPAGTFRPARTSDETTLIAFWRAFENEVGLDSGDPGGAVRGGIAAHQLFVWEDRQIVSMASWTARNSRCVRISFVYTPPDHRNRGYAGASVAALSQKMLDDGCPACVLFADVRNEASNRVYRKIGYQPVCEFAFYHFDPI